MTESAFISLHLQGVINFTSRINVNYDIVTSITAVGEATGTITGVTVTPTSLPDATGTTVSLEGVDMTNALQSITQINFSISLGSFPATQISLQVEPGVYYQNPGGNDFYYFRTAPYTIPYNVADFANPEVNDNVPVIFSPYLQDLVFGYSEFNPLVSNAEITRTSKILSESDRFKGTVLPGNFDAILADTATPADVQDSNYYNTGWTNSRYEGSKSTPTNYGGVLPSLTGRGFTGERFDDNSTDDQVCYAKSRVLEEFFHTGATLLPSMSSEFIGPTLGVSLTPTTTAFTYTTAPGVVLATPIDKGDLIEIENSAGGGKEIMKVTKHVPTQFQLFVIRGYFSTPSNHDSGAQIAKLDNISLFELKDNTTNLEMLNDSKIFIPKNSSIVHTDETGLAYSQSICNPNLIELD